MFSSTVLYRNGEGDCIVFGSNVVRESAPLRGTVAKATGLDIFWTNPSTIFQNLLNGSESSY